MIIALSQAKINKEEVISAIEAALAEVKKRPMTWYVCFIKVKGK